jgi:hypothetical protein
VSCEELGVPPEKAVLGKTPKSGVLSPESSKAFVAQGLDAVVPIVEPFVHGDDQEDHRADADGTGERSSPTYAAYARNTSARRGRGVPDHLIFRTPWTGDPRINIQRAGDKAKPYQVRQVLKAIEKLDEQT